MIAQLPSPSLLRFWRTVDEFDNFKQSHKEQTKRGYSMFPLNELLKYGTMNERLHHRRLFYLEKHIYI